MNQQFISTSQNRHYYQLDTIRGIAAVIVAIFHGLSYLRPVWFNYTPLSLFFGGREMVLLFFFLSGFVLMLAYLKSNKLNYVPFLIKRVFRIWIPTIFACAIVITIFYTTAVVNRPVDTYQIVNTFLLVGEFDAGYFNMPIWTLTHELRISLFIPIMAIMVKRLNLGLNLAVIAIFAVLGTFLGQWTGWSSSLLQTLGFVPLFLCGMLLAKHQVFLIKQAKRLPKSVYGLVLGISILLISYMTYLGQLLESVNFPIVFYLSSIAFSFLIILVMVDGKIARAFSNKYLVKLGDYSFGIYLFHSLIFSIWTFFLQRYMSIVPMAIISLLTFLALIAFFRHCIELPSMKIGKRLANLSGQWISKWLGSQPKIKVLS